MIDLHVDEMHLTELQQKGEQQIFIFTNREKDETLALPVDSLELKSIYDRVRMRCETLDLIPVVCYREDGKGDER